MFTCCKRYGINFIRWLKSLFNLKKKYNNIKKYQKARLEYIRNIEIINRMKKGQDEFIRSSCNEASQ